MAAGELTQLALDALLLMLRIGAPVLAVALLVGFVSALLQGVTQLSDVTLSFVPKLLAVGATLWLMGGWMTSGLVQYTSQLWSGLAELVR